MMCFMNLCHILECYLFPELFLARTQSARRSSGTQVWADKCDDYFDAPRSVIKIRHEKKNSIGRRINVSSKFLSIIKYKYKIARLSPKVFYLFCLFYFCYCFAKLTINEFFCCFCFWGKSFFFDAYAIAQYNQDKFSFWNEFPNYSLALETNMECFLISLSASFCLRAFFS